MLFKILTVILLILLAAETWYVLTHRHPSDRFKVLNDYEYGIVAFDSATGRLCKTLQTKSAAEIEKLDAEAATKSAPCPPLPAPSGDPAIDEMKRSVISKKCGGNGEDVAQESNDNWSIKFVANLHACAELR
jgi:hypothetical protein